MDEILSLLAEYGPMSSKEIAEELRTRGISLEARTVRYHLKKMEERRLVKRTSDGKRVITERGLEELRQKSAFERLGEFSEKIEFNAYFCNFDLLRMEGMVPTNVTILDKDHYEKTMKIMAEMQEFPFLIHRNIAVFDEGESIDTFTVPQGKFALVTVSNTVYDVITRFSGVNMTPEFAGLLNCHRWKPRGITELISYAGTTLSPGLLFLKSGLTSVYQCLKTGRGEIITAIRSFSRHAIDIVREEIQLARSKGLGGVVYILHPSSKELSLPPGNRARLIVAAGLNHIAPLQELGFDPDIKVIEAFLDFKALKPPDRLS